MSVLTIRVVDPPISLNCGPYTDIALTVQKGKEFLQEQRPAGAELVFFAEINERGGGPFVFGPKGERFLYLAWVAGPERDMFRRIKVMLPETIDRDQQITIAGQDTKGGPACARATVLEPWG